MNPSDRKLLERFSALHKKNRPSPLDLAFDKQKAFILDPSRMKCLFCTRRAAKSYTAGIYAFHVALTNPGCNVVLIGLTRQSAKGIFWKDVLKDLDKKLGTKVVPNMSELTITFPNGSVIYVTGIDANEDQMNKLLGRKYKLVGLDEGSMYSVNLDSFTALIKPALADQAGTLCMFGTSSNITRGLFFDVSRGAEPGWSLHTWAAFENPHMADQWAWEIAEIEHDRPQFMKTALFRQHYLNEWVIDDEALVYKYDPTRNLIRELPRFTKPGGWQHVLGVDLGFNDDTSFVVLAFHENDKRLFVARAEKKKGLDFTDVAKRIADLDKIYSFSYKVVDGANKQGVAEMNNRHGVGLVAADKTDKVSFIRLMNDDLVQGNIVLLPGALGLAEEWSTLVWCTDVGGKIIEPRRENPNLPNHLADAANYAWRRTYQYLSERAIEEPSYGTSEWGKQEEDRMWQAELDKADAEKDVRDGWGNDDWEQ